MSELTGRHMRLQIKEQSMLPGAPAVLTSQGNFQRRPGKCKHECVCTCACYAIGVKGTANSSLMKHFDFLHKKICPHDKVLGDQCTSCVQMKVHQRPVSARIITSSVRSLWVRTLVTPRTLDSILLCVPMANSVHRWHLG